MEKAAQLQHQIRQNNNELTDFLKDLTRWEEKVQDEDTNLKTARKLEENLPPIRSKVKKPKVPAPPDEEVKNEKPKEKSSRISSYDYDAWSKFDADAACQSASGDESNEEVEEDEENDEELERIQQQKQLQKALLEKEKGNQLFKEGKYEAAINRYTIAIGLNPTNPVLYANRAMALIKTEKFGAAEQDCNSALQLDPSYSKAIARRATARKKLKKYDESLEDYARLLEIEPKNQQAVSEIKDIKKMLAATKHLEENDNSTSETTERESEKRRRRLNKPLKRIHITEVGIDEDREKEGRKTENKTPINAKLQQAVPHVNGESTNNNISQLPIPTTSFMFETVYKKLKTEEEKLYLYLKNIPLPDYGKLFHQCIDSLISAFLSILKDFYMRDQLPYHEEMSMFATVKRFDMAAMFLSRKDKQTLEDLFKNMSSQCYGYALEGDFVKTLAKKYSVKI